MQPANSPGLRRLRWTAPVFLMIVACYWIAALFVIAVDPLDLHSWGTTPRRAHNTTVEAHEDLIPSVIRDPEVDVLLVGGSTTASYNADQMRSWIAGAKNPANVSYYSPRPADHALVLDLIERSSRARRIVLVYNTYYTEELSSLRPNFPTYLLQGGLGNELRAVSPHNIALAAGALEDRPLYETSDADAVEEARRVKTFRSFQTRAAMDKLASELAGGEGRLSIPAPQACSAYPAVTQLLVPFVRRMSRRGVKIDIMMPAYSSAMYGYWSGVPDIIARYKPAFFERDLAARRCTVELLNGTPNVRVVAFESERWITDDLANYRDPVHLYSANAARFLFSHLDSDAYRLTRGNVGAYVGDLRQHARSYQPFNSVIGYGHAS